MQIIYFVILIFSIIIHEVAHGYAADKLGDPTARYAGRLTLNPIPHIDFLGSIVLPIISVLSPGGLLFGLAKPVPYNSYNLTRAPRWGETIVAAAGPGTNFALVVIFAVLLRLASDQTFGAICFIGILVNLWLGLLNLIPVPPLDGSQGVFGVFSGARAPPHCPRRARDGTPPVPWVWASSSFSRCFCFRPGGFSSPRPRALSEKYPKVPWSRRV